MKRLFLASALILLFFGSAYSNPFMQLMSGSPPAAPSGQLFFSDFEDSNDRNQWYDVDANFDLACDSVCEATSPLFGTYSAKMEAASSARAMSADITDNSNSEIYMRIALRALSYTGTGNGLSIRLIDSTTAEVARGRLYVSTDGAYRIYADSAGGTEALTAFTNDLLNDATYFLVVSYIKGASVTATLYDSTMTQMHTRSISTTSDTDVVEIEVATTRQSLLIDNAEARSDTNWGE